MKGLKLAMCTKAFVSLVKTLYHKEIRLVLPIPVKGSKNWKKDEKEHKNYDWIRKISEKKKKKLDNIKVSECLHAHVGHVHVYAGFVHAYAC